MTTKKIGLLLDSILSTALLLFGSYYLYKSAGSEFALGILLLTMWQNMHIARHSKNPLGNES